MSRVRVLVGTRKGAFILTSDGARMTEPSGLRQHGKESVWQQVTGGVCVHALA